MAGATTAAEAAVELERLAGELRRIYEGEAWHGPSVSEALAGVSAGQAARRSLPGAHSIFELTHHLAAWTGEVTRRLRGGSPSEPEDGDFPERDAAVDEAKWESTKSRLAARNAELVSAIRAFDAARLDVVVGGTDGGYAPPGATYRAMLHGLVSHDAYHAGQIVLLRKTLE